MSRLIFLSLLFCLTASTAWPLGLGAALRRSSASAPRLSIANRIALGTLTTTSDSSAAPVQIASAVQLGNLTPVSTSNAYLTGIQSAVLTGTVGRAINGVPVYSDDFTGPDNTSLATHDPNWTSFGSWDEVYSAGAGRLKLSGGLATTTSSTAYGGAYYAASTSDTVSVTIKGGGTTGMKGVTLRSGAGTASATGIGYQVYLSNATGGNWKRLTIARKGTVLYYGTVSVSAASDHALRVKILPQGDGRLFIYGYLDGSQGASLSYTETAANALPPGHPGIFISGAGTAADNYLDAWSDQ